MLMPVPQTLAKKLNKDVFQGGEREREREATCILSGVGHTSQTLSRPEKRQGQASVKKKKPSIKSDKTKSASSTAALGKRAGRSRQRRG